MSFLIHPFQRNHPTKQEQAEAYKRQKKIESEQHALSIFLLQKLVSVYTQNRENLIVKYGAFNGWNPSDYVTVSTKDNKFIYQVLHQKSEPYNYWLETGPDNICFGLYSNDNSFFKDKKNDYLCALYQFFHITHHNDFPEISELMSKKVQIDLTKTEAWPSYRMRVFPFLDNFLTHNK